MDNKKNMMFTKKAIAAIIIPLIFQSILTVTIGMVDSMMVSHKGEAAFAGVSLVGSLDAVLVTLFGAMTAGGSVVLAQAMGQGDKSRACEAAKQLVYVAAASAAFVTTVVLVFRRPLLGVLFGDIEESVMNNAQDYFFFMALSFPFLAIENSVTATFRAQGDSMISLKISLLMNVVNICGNAIFIYAANLGAMGAAIATLIARIIGAVIMVWIAHNKKRFIHYERIFHYKPDLPLIKSVLSIGIPNGVENTMFQFGKLMTASLVSSLGTVAIVANSAAIHLANFQYNAGAAVQSTMVAVVGRCMGAEEKEQAKHYARSLLLVGYGIVFGVDLILCVFSVPLLGLYDLSGESFEVARKLLFYHSAVSVLIWPVAFCLPPAFRAASDVKFTMVVSVISMWALRVAMGYFLALETITVFGVTMPFSGMGMGIFGVWVAMTMDWALRALLFVWRFFSGKWLTKYKGVGNRTKAKTA